MILVFDLGTTYFKFALVGRDGQLIDWCGFSPPTHVATDGLMELDVSDFASVMVEGISRLKSRQPNCLKKVRAVTFASQTNSFVLLDHDNRPLTPIILWPDRRACGMQNELYECCGMPDFSATTGIPELTFRSMAAKLLWLRKNAPDVWSRANKLCLIADYLTLLLTNQHVTEVGSAGLTGLVDIRFCRWWPSILSRISVPDKWLPELVRAGTDLGPIIERAALQFGLPSDCHFIAGCLDQYAGAMGVGNVMPGMVSETTGTVLATVRCADHLILDRHPQVFQGPAFREGLYYCMTFGNVSARYLEWYRGQLSDRPDFDELSELAARIEPGAAGLSLRTDVELTCVENVFIGMTPRHTRGHVVRCIMETVAAALRQQVNILGVPPIEVRSAGGAARSEVWQQIKADMLGVPVITTQCPEPTSLGAAMLAEASLGGADVAKIARQWVRLKSSQQLEPHRN